MIVCKKHFYKINFDAQRGASVLETLMAISVVLAVSPFVYNQIANISDDVKDMMMANKIVNLRDGVINFLRVNQDKWEDTVEIKLSQEELDS